MDKVKWFSLPRRFSDMSCTKVFASSTLMQEAGLCCCIDKLYFVNWICQTGWIHALRRGSFLYFPLKILWRNCLRCREIGRHLHTILYSEKTWYVIHRAMGHVSLLPFCSFFCHFIQFLLQLHWRPQVLRRMNWFAWMWNTFVADIWS